MRCLLFSGVSGCCCDMMSMRAGYCLQGRRILYSFLLSREAQLETDVEPVFMGNIAIWDLIIEFFTFPCATSQLRNLFPSSPTVPNIPVEPLFRAVVCANNF